MRMSVIPEFSITSASPIFATVIPVAPLSICRFANVRNFMRLGVRPKFEFDGRDSILPFATDFAPSRPDRR